MHWPPRDGNEKIDAAWETMAKLKEEGKVKWIGVSNFNTVQLGRAQKIAPITSLQPPYNLTNRMIEKEMLPFCKENHLGVIVYSPMASGLLTGTFTRERITNLPGNDWRHKSVNYQEPKLSYNLRIVEILIDIANKHNRTAGEVAIAWTLMNPVVSGAIVGVRNSAQAEVIMKASDIVLSKEEKNQLESIL
jgi:aryl-alcohol dehydrogenase-like predicted oxidoreductase